MEINYSNLKRILFESLLEEDKSRMIDKLVLPDIEDEDEKVKFKNQLKEYFKKYSAFERFIDWNKWKTLTSSDFDEVLAKAGQSLSARRSQERKSSGIDPKSLFQNVKGRRFNILDENADWLFVEVLNYKAAVYCDSKECGGGSAKWCIGYEESNEYWNNYTRDYGSRFVMAFNKHFDTMPPRELFTNLKYMIEISEDTYSDVDVKIWNQADKSSGMRSKLSRSIFGDDKSVINKIIEKMRGAAIDERGFVVRVTNDCINKGVYTPPRGAVGVDFSNFYWNYNLKDFNRIYIPAYIKEIARKGFYGWGATEKVIFEPRTDPIIIGDKAFGDMSDLNVIKFPPNAIFGKNILGFEYLYNDDIREVHIAKKYIDDPKLLRQTLGKLDYQSIKFVLV